MPLQPSCGIDRHMDLSKYPDIHAEAEAISVMNTWLECSVKNGVCVDRQLPLEIHHYCYWWSSTIADQLVLFTT
jgi:hypothetical protein